MDIPPELLQESTLIKSGVKIGEQALLKEQQPALSIGAQIQNLKNLNLSVSDDTAKEVLNNVSYYRLIKAYGISLKEKNTTFGDGVSFSDILELYTFNSKFRQLLFVQIEKIEVAFRCRLSNYLCEKYGVLFYNSPEIFQDKQHYCAFINETYESIAKNRRSPFVKNFQENYIDGQIPFYALVEILSFGTISKMYKNLKSQDKKEIAKFYGISWPYLESWMESIAYVRNICAHYGRLYNVRLDKTPMLSKEAKEAGLSNNRIFGVLHCMSRLLPEDPEWDAFVSDIDKLFTDYLQANKETMGFPNDWQERLRKV